MKRFMKGCAITALIFAVVGSVLASVGSWVAGRTTISEVVDAVTGGRVSVDSNAWWNWGIHGWNGLVRMGIADFADSSETDYGYDYGSGRGNYAEGYSGGDVTFLSEYEMKEGNVNRFCPGTDIYNLEIDVGGCYFVVENSDDGYLYLEAENVYKFRSSLKGGTLYINSSSKNATNWSDVGNCQITLYVPYDYWFGEVEMNLGAGYLSFGDLRADAVSMEVGAGEIDLGYVEASKLDMSVGAGSVIIDYMDIGELKAEIGMGQLQASGDIYAKADIECSMGDVTLYLEGRETDFNYQLEGALGNINVGRSGFGGFAQEKHVDNGSSKDIEVECSMGNISILFEE